MQNDPTAPFKSAHEEDLFALLPFSVMLVTSIGLYSA